MLQLDFFEKDQITSLRNDLIACQNSGGKVRRAVFARLNVLEHEHALFSERLKYIEAYICKGNEKTAESNINLIPPKQKEKNKKTLNINEAEKDLFDFMPIDIEIKIS